MKKILTLILCLGMGVACASCGTSNGSEPQGSVSNRVETSTGSDTKDSTSEVTGSNEEDSSSGSSSDSSDDSSTVTPPIINGENELPLVPVG